MREYYCFATEDEARACVSYINSTPWFPVVSSVAGQSAPDRAQTLRWVDAPTQMVSGEWAVPRIEVARLDTLGVTQPQRDQFLAAFGQDIRTLSSVDFTNQEEGDEK